MNIFVTGASGFIGKALIKELAERKHKVSVLQHKKAGFKESSYRVYQGDISDFSVLKKASTNAEVVFHLAASMGADQVSEREFMRINKKGTELVLKAAEEAGVKKFVHFSSAGVFGSVRQKGAVRENYPRNPISVYDRSKRAGEDAVLNFPSQKMRIMVVRPGWVYGPEDRRTFKLIKAIADKRFIFVTGKKTLQTPVYINDLIKGVLLCAERGKNGEIYHLAGKEILTVREIAEKIADALETHFPTLALPLWFIKTVTFIFEKGYRVFGREAPLTRGRLAFFTHSKPLSIKKAELELGYSPEYDFRTGIQKTISWYEEKGWLSH